MRWNGPGECSFLQIFAKIRISASGIMKMKILINTADLHPDERVYPDYEIAQNCSGGNIDVYMSKKNAKNDEYLRDAMYSVWEMLPTVDGIEACDWCEDIEHSLLVVVKDDFDWFAFAKNLETDFKFLKNTKLITLEFQFENFAYIQSLLRSKFGSKKCAA